MSKIYKYYVYGSEGDDTIKGRTNNAAKALKLAGDTGRIVDLGCHDMRAFCVIASAKHEHTPEGLIGLIRKDGNNITNKTSHTPGPWHVDKGDRIYILTDDNASIGTVEADEKGSREDGYIPYSEGLNNATLIAAAPELLAALEIAQKELEALYNVGRTIIDARPECDWNRMVKADNKARAAIAKAKGE